MKAKSISDKNIISFCTRIIFVLLALCLFQKGEAQSLGFEFQEKSNVESIPFEYINGFIIVDLTINHTFPLQFIFDTGANNSIIINKEITQLLNLPFGRTFTVYGADLTTPLYAHLVNSVHLASGELVAPHQDILVLEEDYFNFHQLTGIKVHGILGSDMFSRYKIKVDYKERNIKFYKNEKKKLKTKGFQEMQMAVQKSKPYVMCASTLGNDTDMDLKLLIDTGASTALLLDTKSDSSMVLPDQIIPGDLGFGIGGTMQGYVGRIPLLQIGNKSLENVVCHFQESPPVSDSLKFIFRHGLIGNHILDRFEMVIDYPNQKFYLKPERKWKRTFVYDKSGIRFISAGLENKTFYIHSILPDSPAAAIGIKTGDIIKKINRKPEILLTYDGITRILRGKAGKKVKLKVKRGDLVLKYQFQLKDMI